MILFCLYFWSPFSHFWKKCYQRESEEHKMKGKVSNIDWVICWIAAWSLLSRPVSSLSIIPLTHCSLSSAMIRLFSCFFILVLYFSIHYFLFFFFMVSFFSQWANSPLSLFSLLLRPTLCPLTVIKSKTQICWPISYPSPLTIHSSTHKGPFINYVIADRGGGVSPI